MANQISSKSDWFAYKLFVQELPKSDNPEAEGWECRILMPNGQPAFAPHLDGPFVSVEIAEATAEQVVRDLRELKGQHTDPDHHPVWTRITIPPHL